MLDSIREGSHSFFIKIALGAIIVVFVFWGIGASSPPAGVIVKVNGENITIQEFNNVYPQFVNSFMQQSPEITEEILRSLGIEQHIVQTLITQELLNQESERTGIDVSSYLLAQAISQLPAFYNTEGVFDKEVYVELLKSEGQNPASFENSLREEALVGKFRSDLTSGVMMHSASVETFYMFQNETRSMEYVVFEKDLAGQSVTEEEIQTYYDTNLNNYMLPAKISLEYILFSPEELSATYSITDDEILVAYEERKSQFMQPEQLRASHILIQSNPNDAKQMEVALEQITAIEERIRAGEDFATVAKEVGQDATAPEGGDLGWFIHSQMVATFADAAFALEVGEMSAPVQSEYGYHLIWASDRKPVYTQSLEEVSDSLRASLAMENANFYIENIMDNTMAAVLQGDSLDDAATKFGLSSVIVENLMSEDLMADLGLSLADAQVLMLSSKGSLLENPLLIAGSPALIKVLDKSPLRARALSEVEVEIESILRNEKAHAAALVAAESLAQKLAAGEENTMPLRETVPFARTENIVELGQNVQVVQNIFSAKNTDWHANAYIIGDSIIVARLGEVVTPSKDDFLMEGFSFGQQISFNLQEIVFQSYLYELRKAAKIEVLIPEFFAMNKV